MVSRCTRPPWTSTNSVTLARPTLLPAFPCSPSNRCGSSSLGTDPVSTTSSGPDRAPLPRHSWLCRRLRALTPFMRSLMAIWRNRAGSRSTVTGLKSVAHRQTGIPEAGAQGVGGIAGRHVRCDDATAQAQPGCLRRGQGLKVLDHRGAAPRRERPQPPRAGRRQPVDQLLGRGAQDGERGSAARGPRRDPEADRASPDSCADTGRWGGRPRAMVPVVWAPDQRITGRRLPGAYRREWSGRRPRPPGTRPAMSSCVPARNGR